VHFSHYRYDLFSEDKSWDLEAHWCSQISSRSCQSEKTAADILPSLPLFCQHTSMVNAAAFPLAESAMDSAAWSSDAVVHVHAALVHQCGCVEHHVPL